MFKLGDKVFVTYPNHLCYMGEIIQIEAHLIWPFRIKIEAFYGNNPNSSSLLALESELHHWPLSKLEEVIYGI